MMRNHRLGFSDPIDPSPRGVRPSKSNPSLRTRLEIRDDQPRRPRTPPTCFDKSCQRYWRYGVTTVVLLGILIFILVFLESEGLYSPAGDDEDEVVQLTVTARSRLPPVSTTSVSMAVTTVTTLTSTSSDSSFTTSTIVSTSTRLPLAPTTSRNTFIPIRSDPAGRDIGSWQIAVLVTIPALALLCLGCWCFVYSVRNGRFNKRHDSQHHSSVQNAGQSRVASTPDQSRRTDIRIDEQENVNSTMPVRLEPRSNVDASAPLSEPLFRNEAHSAQNTANNVDVSYLDSTRGYGYPHATQGVEAKHIQDWAMYAHQHVSGPANITVMQEECEHLQASAPPIIRTSPERRDMKRMQVELVANPSLRPDATDKVHNSLRYTPDEEYSTPEGSDKYNVPEGSDMYNVPEGSDMYNVPEGRESKFPRQRIDIGQPSTSKSQGESIAPSTTFGDLLMPLRGLERGADQRVSHAGYLKSVLKKTEIELELYKGRDDKEVVYAPSSIHSKTDEEKTWRSQQTIMLHKKPTYYQQNAEVSRHKETALYQDPETTSKYHHDPEASVVTNPLTLPPRSSPQIIHSPSLPSQSSLNYDASYAMTADNWLPPPMEFKNSVENIDSSTVQQAPDAPPLPVRGIPLNHSVQDETIC